MRVIVADTAGFCWGVQRAIEFALDEARGTGEPVYTYGKLIHNNQVLEELNKRNIFTLQGDVEEARNGSLIVRAHGIRPDEYEDLLSRHDRVRDATCPLVMTVHKKIKRYQDEGYQIVIMGKSDHAEVLGLIGAARDRAIVVPADVRAVEKLEYIKGKVCLVSQTTQNYQVFDQVADVLKSKCDELLVANTICEPTRSHQMETREIAERSDTVVVVGSRESSNTRKLAELAREIVPRVIHVETELELKAEDFRNAKVVGVTAGASTPQWMILRVVDRLKSFNGRSGVFQWFLRNAFDLIVPTHFHTILTFLSLYTGIVAATGIHFDYHAFFTTLAFIFGLHAINEFSESSVFDRRSRLAPASFEMFRRSMLFLAAVSISGGALMSIHYAWKGIISPVIPMVQLFAATGGILYSWQLVPQQYIRHLGFRSIKDLPGSKDLSITLGWTLLLASTLIFSGGVGFDLKYLIALLLASILIYRRSALMVVLDVQGDRIVSMESSFKFLGKVKSRKLHRLIDRVTILLWGVLAFLLWEKGWIPSFFILLSLLMGLYFSHLYRRRQLPMGTISQFVQDLQFIIPAFGGWLVYRFYL